MIRTCLLMLVGCFCLSSFGQVTLDECRAAAQQNYPLARQYDLLRLSEQYTLDNATRGNLPQVSLSGKVSYQSEATTFPFDIPGIGMKGLPKDQYQIQLEVTQNIWDGGNIRARKEQVKTETEESRRQLNVTMYALNEQVNQVFFGILLIDEQLEQNRLLEEDLQRNLKNIRAYRDNGIANDADVDAVQVEILNTRQQRTQLTANRTAYLRMLSLLTGKPLDEQTQLIRPVSPDDKTAFRIARPELDLYNAQVQSLEVERHNLQAGYMPRIGLFAQGAYGNPGLDFLKDQFRSYYIVGARLTWNFGNLYTLKNDKRKLDTRRLQIESNRDLFLFNTRLQLAEQDGILLALQKQMKDDDEIIRLRSNIRQSAEAKVANGTLSVTEMLREVTAESLARQAKALHEIQLLMHQYQQQHLTNNQPTINP